MLPDLRHFVRGLHRELLARHAQHAPFETAGGIKTYADLSVAYVLVNSSDGAAIVAAYEAKTGAALDELLPALARAGVGAGRLDEARRLIAACARESAAAVQQPFERSRALAAAAARGVELARAVPRDPRTLDLVERLVAAEQTFGIDWNAAVARTVASLSPVAGSADSQELRVEALQAYVESLYPERRDLRVEQFRPLPGAHSREVYFFDLVDASGRREALVLRRDRERNATPSSVAEERPIMETLRQRGFAVPEVIAAGVDRRALGRAFLAMRKVAGSELAQRSDLARYVPAVARLLAQLHRTPVEGLSFPLALLSPPLDTAWARLLEQRLAIWHEFQPAPSAIMERAYGWLQDHRDRVAGRFCCVHGDFQPQNLLVDDAGLVGLLDFEVCHLGHPGEDLLAIRARIEPAVKWREFFDAYVAAGGPAVSEAELEFCAVWVPFFYATIVAAAYDTFVNHAGFDLSTGAPAIVHLPQLMQLLSRALAAAG